MTCEPPSDDTLVDVIDRSSRPGPLATHLGVFTMRTIRLAFLALLASFTLTACTSPTAYDDDCDPETEDCNFGHPGSGN